MRPARTEPLQPLRTEDGNNWDLQKVRKMHWTAVIAHKKTAVRKDG